MHANGVPVCACARVIGCVRVLNSLIHFKLVYSYIRFIYSFQISLLIHLFPIVSLLLIYYFRV